MTSSPNSSTQTLLALPRRAAPMPLSRLDLELASVEIRGTVLALVPLLPHDRLCVPAGLWWKWKESGSPDTSWATIAKLCDAPRVPPKSFHAPLKWIWRSIRPETFELMREARAQVRQLGLSSCDFLHVMALLAQQAGKRKGVQQLLASAPALPEAAPVVRRRWVTRKEATSTLPTLWAGSHIGPAYAAKAENQDATCIKRSSERLVFALADGVSTSVGARYAASIVVAEFCRALHESYQPLDPQPALQRAVRVAQEQLQARLEHLLQHESDPDWKELRSHTRMPQESALHLLRNTLSPANPRFKPQLATTLIGGMLCRRGRALMLHLVRIGDGLVELLSASGAVTTLLPMDVDDVSLHAYVCPGPIGSSAVDCAELVSLELPSDGERILVSSDGLARGHGQSVASALGIACPDWSRRLSERAGDATPVLDAAARFADRRYDQKREEYFGDNLSLIVIHCKSESKSQ